MTCYTVHNRCSLISRGEEVREGDGLLYRQFDQFSVYPKSFKKFCLGNDMVTSCDAAYP